MIARALERTASLWPDVEYAYRFVHAVAHGLGNPHEESASMVRRRVNGILGAMQRHRVKAGTLAGAFAHFQKVTRSYRPGLFHTYAVPDLPRTNNDLEQLFGSQRYHERRATGRKTAAPGAVLRGSVRLLAATANSRLFTPQMISDIVADFRSRSQNQKDLAQSFRAQTHWGSQRFWHERNQLPYGF